MAKPTNGFPIVGVGASAGGLEAFTQLLQNLPPDTGMAFVLVQHLDPDHDSALTQLLSKATSMSVREVTNNLRVEPNHVYVIPPNTNMGIAQRVLKLQPREVVKGAHRSIDFFLESLAQDQCERAIGVILSGTATDGTQGLEAIKAEGGITFAQNESAKYGSMPRNAVATGCVDFVLAPDSIAKELGQIARHPAKPSLNQEIGFKNILMLLGRHCGVDFSFYKTSTIERRLHRRMVLNKLTRLPTYAQSLEGNVKELDALYSDMLINVTGFFRNPEAFEALKRSVFPKLVRDRRNEPVRMWVAGCSTGQEAYSLAMAFTEFSDDVKNAPKFQIFATDLKEDVLEKARTGFYSKTMVPATDVSPARLQRFFVEQDGGYVICKPLRESIVFARQNLLSDPPFSRMDLISCRNLLIYIEPNLQKKIIPTFHYALKPEGCLFLGASESIGSFSNLFRPAEKRHKIYFRKPGLSPALQLQRLTKYQTAENGTTAPKELNANANANANASAQREADRITMNRFAPIGVLVNADLEIVQFRGDTSSYLKPPTGQASFSLLKMTHDGLTVPLRMALEEAKKRKNSVRKKNISVNQNGRIFKANFEVVPLTNLQERSYLIFFEDAAANNRRSQAAPSPEPLLKERGGRATKMTQRESSQRESSRRISELEIELAQARDSFQSLQEQSEAAHEELQGSNEEISSGNEELQSVNEELETSKEELESTNEELITVNEELSVRNTELNRLNTDLMSLQTSLKQNERTVTAARDYAESIIRSVRDPLLILNADWRVHTANESYYTIFNASPAETEGLPISELGKGQWNNPKLRALLRDIFKTNSSFHNFEVTCDFDSVGPRTMLLNGRGLGNRGERPEKILLGIQDITELARTQVELRRSELRYRRLFESARDGVLLMDAVGRKILDANPFISELLGYAREELVGKELFEIGLFKDKAVNEGVFQELQQKGFLRYEGSLETKTGEIKEVEFVGNLYQESRENVIQCNIRDITGRKKSEDVLRQTQVQLADRADYLEQAVAERTKELTTTNQQLETFVYSIAHDLRAPLRSMQGFATMLEEEAGATLSDLGRDHAHRISESAQFMDALVRDLLAFSRISQQRIEMAPVNLETTVSAALSHAEQEIQATKARVETVGPWPTVLAHEATLGQVIFNLVSNALKFTDPRRPPLIRFRTEERQGWVRLWIEDNGIGIAPEHQEQIFRLFTRLHNEKYSGTGIGLAIVQKGVERIGGKVGLESVPDRGSRFWIELRTTA